MHKRLRLRNLDACSRRYGPAGMAAASDYSQAIGRYLQACHITLADQGLDQLMRPAMPGIVVLAGEELFIGRAHLPLLAARLGITAT